MVGGLERAQCLAAQIAQCYVLTDDQLRIVTAIQEHAPDETANQSDKKAAG
jgi:hypothetical protein